jgi:ribosomal-protein-alanine N-acetyltransferase
MLADVPALFRFLGDPRAMRFTHVDASLRDCRRRIAVHEWFRRRDGYAPWTVVRKSDGQTIGWGGLYNDPFDPGWGVEVGYHFDPAAWGQGYASELVAACMDVADEPSGCPRSPRLPMPGMSARVASCGRLRAGALRPGYAPFTLSAPQVQQRLIERQSHRLGHQRGTR